MSNAVYNETNVVAINDLTEKTTAVGQDDLLVIAEKVDDAYITKSIKANAVGGGGGGGSSDFEALELTFNNGVISTVKTASEIEALYSSGKCFGGAVALTMPGMTIYVQLQFGFFALQDGTYVLEAGTMGFEEYMKIEFTAASANSVMTATLGG